MKASRITAVGLVAAASALDRVRPFPAARDARKAAPPFAPAKARPRSCSASPSTDANVRAAQPQARAVRPHRGGPARSMVTARTGGVLTELRVRRGARVEKGDIIAVLSDEAREAQVAQAKALVTQRTDRARRQAQADRERHAAEARAGQSRSAAQGGGGGAGHGRGRARPRRRARAVVAASSPTLPVEVGQAAFSMAGREIAQIVALDPMLAVVEVAERKLAGVKVGDTAEVRLVTGETAIGQDPFRRQDREPDHAHLSGRGRNAEPGRRDPGRHHRRGRDAARAGAGDARAALGADVLFGRRHRRAHVGDGDNVGFVPVTWSRTSRPTCGSPASPTARG